MASIHCSFKRWLRRFSILKNIGKQSCVDVSVVKVTLQTFNSISLVRYLLSRPATNLFPKRHFSGEVFRCTWCQDNFLSRKGISTKDSPVWFEKVFRKSKGRCQQVFTEFIKAETLVDVHFENQIFQLTLWFGCRTCQGLSTALVHILRLAERLGPNRSAAFTLLYCQRTYTVTQHCSSK